MLQHQCHGRRWDLKNPKPAAEQVKESFEKRQGSEDDVYQMEQEAHEWRNCFHNAEFLTSLTELSENAATTELVKPVESLPNATQTIGDITKPFIMATGFEDDGIIDNEEAVKEIESFNPIVIQ